MSKKKKRKTARPVETSRARFFSEKDTKAARTVRRFDAVLLGLVIAALVLVPLVCDPRTHDVYLTVKRVLLYVLAGALAVVRLLRCAYADRHGLAEEQPPPVRTFAVLLFVFFAAAVLSFTAALNLYEGFAAFAHWSAVMFIGFTVAERFANGRNARRLLSAVAGTGTVVALYGLLQAAGADFSFVAPEATKTVVSTLGNRNYAGQFLVAAIPAALGLCFCVRSRAAKIFWGAAAALMFIHLLLTKSRGAWVGFCLGLVAGATILLADRKLRTSVLRRWKAVALAATVVVVLFVVGATCTAKGQVLSRRAASAFDLRSPTVRLRLGMWRGTARLSADHPVRGVGLGNFQFVYPLYRPAAESASGRYRNTTDNPHNEYLHLLSETGPLGLAAFLAAVLFALRQLFRRLGKEDAEASWLRPALGASVVGVMGHALFSFPFYLPASALVFWTAVGLAAGGRPTSVEPTDAFHARKNARVSFAPVAHRRGTWRLAARIFFLGATVLNVVAVVEAVAEVGGGTVFGSPVHILAVAVGWWAVLGAAAFRFHAVERPEADAGRSETRTVRPARLLQPRVVGAVVFAAAFALNLGVFAYAGFAGSCAARQGDLYRVRGRWREAEPYYRRAVALLPWDYHVRYNHAVVLHHGGETGAAKKEYAKVLALHPHHEWVFRELGELYREQGRIERALECYAEALRRNPGHVRAYIDRALVYRQQGRYALAQAELERAWKLNVERALVCYNQGLTWEAAGDFAQAVEDCEKALRLDPNFYAAEECLAKLVLLYERQGEIKQAVRKYEREWAKHPGSYLTARIMAALYGRRGDRERELQWLKRALRAQPNQPTVQQTVRILERNKRRGH